MAKKRGKQWYTMVAPEMFGGVELGKTLAEDPKTLIDRKIDTSLMDLVNDFKKYYMKFSFQVVDVNGEKAMTRFVGSTCLRDYVSRMVGRWSTRVDTIQDLTTKDGLKVRIKGILIIPRRVKSSIKSAVRDDARATIKSEVEKSTLEEMVNDIISDKIKRKVLRNAQRIYPVKSFEIRKSEVISSE